MDRIEGEIPEWKRGAVILSENQQARSGKKGFISGE